MVGVRPGATVGLVGGGAGRRPNGQPIRPWPSDVLPRGALGGQHHGVEIPGGHQGSEGATHGADLEAESQRRRPDLDDLGFSEVIAPGQVPPEELDGHAVAEGLEADHAG
ncbi:MAG: hypothetical protein ACK5QX_01015, partial [bacterium]